MVGVGSPVAFFSVKKSCRLPSTSLHPSVVNTVPPLGALLHVPSEEREGEAALEKGVSRIQEFKDSKGEEQLSIATRDGERNKMRR